MVFECAITIVLSMDEQFMPTEYIQDIYSRKDNGQPAQEHSPNEGCVVGIYSVFKKCILGTIFLRFFEKFDILACCKEGFKSKHWAAPFES